MTYIFDISLSPDAFLIVFLSNWLFKKKKETYIYSEFYFSNSETIYIFEISHFLWSFQYNKQVILIFSFSLHFLSVAFCLKLFLFLDFGTEFWSSLCNCKIQTLFDFCLSLLLNKCFTFFLLKRSNILFTIIIPVLTLFFRIVSTRIICVNSIYLAVSVCWTESNEAFRPSSKDSKAKTWA